MSWFMTFLRKLRLGSLSLAMVTEPRSSSSKPLSQGHFLPLPLSSKGEVPVDTGSPKSFSVLKAEGDNVFYSSLKLSLVFKNLA